MVVIVSGRTPRVRYDQPKQMKHASKTRFSFPFVDPSVSQSINQNRPEIIVLTQQRKQPLPLLTSDPRVANYQDVFRFYCVRGMGNNVVNAKLCKGGQTPLADRETKAKKIEVLVRIVL